MKKTLFSGLILLITLWIIFTTVFAYNVDMNIAVRSKINQWIKPYEVISAAPGYYYQNSDFLEVVEGQEVLIEKSKTIGKHFFNVYWLKASALTYHYDIENEQLNIAGSDILIEIHKDKSTWINGTRTDYAWDVFIETGNVYIAYEDVVASGLQDRFGIVLQNSSGGNVIFSNAYNAYDYASISIETYMFSEIDTLRAYLETVRNEGRFFKFSNIFEAIEVMDVLSNEKVNVFKIDDEILQVVTQSGDVGYIFNGNHITIETNEIKQKPITKAKINREGPVVLTWEAVYSSNPDTELIPELKGLNVISPTWYELSSVEGDVDSKASRTYVDWASGRGYEVWALVSNAFDLDLTHGFLSNSKSRKQFIDYMVQEAIDFGYSGINIDFENVYLEDKDALTHFVQEFAYTAYKNDIVLSMDVTVMGGSDTWSKCYDHEALGRIVDYLIIMTYDEYWQSSPISGPVASYDWVRKHIVEITKVVDTDKIVLGIPLYTRVWRERPSVDIPNKMTTKSSAVGMRVQNEFVEKNNIALIWDDIDKLYFGSFFEEDALVKVWVENSESIKHKVLLVNELGLAGVAAWRRGFELPEIWDVIQEALE